jgi:hypothetical protein
MDIGPLREITMTCVATQMRSFVLGLTVAIGLALALPLGPVRAEEPAGPAIPGSAPEWRGLDAGFEVAEMPVLADGREIDRILLARIDPAKFRFVLQSTPPGRTLKSWMGELGALMVINGSFFAKDRTPDTPIVSNGVQLGPKTYDARHGAFVASHGAAGIRDLRREDWRQSFAGAETALVSYPLLLAEDGGHTATPSDRRANRSFAGQDTAGRIVFGTTQDGSFTLPGLAEFLKASPLGLSLALNLDGGPYACQAIAVGGYRRNFCGTLEFGGKADGPLAPPDNDRNARTLPIILGVVRP